MRKQGTKLVQDDTTIIEEEERAEQDKYLGELVSRFRYRGYVGSIFYYAGHLNGYVDISQSPLTWDRNFHWAGSSNYIPLKCHGGITYGCETDLIYRIGFDCGHAEDLTYLGKTYTELTEADRNRVGDGGVFVFDTWKNEDFVMDNIKLIIDQLIELDQGKQATNE